MLKLDGPGIVIRRDTALDDDPDLTHVMIAATNGRSSLSCEFYLRGERFREIGSALVSFPRSSVDQFVTSLGRRSESSFLRIRAFTWGAKHDSALEFEAVTKGNEVEQASVAFAIAAEAAALNGLGHLLIEYAKLKYIDLHWPGSDGQLFAFERLDLAR